MAKLVPVIVALLMVGCRSNSPDMSRYYDFDAKVKSIQDNPNIPAANKERIITAIRQNAQQAQQMNQRPNGDKVKAGS